MDGTEIIFPVIPGGQYSEHLKFNRDFTGEFTYIYIYYINI